MVQKTYIVILSAVGYEVTHPGSDLRVSSSLSCPEGGGGSSLVY
jgi:hypothetical protein